MTHDEQLLASLNETRAAIIEKYNTLIAKLDAKRAQLNSEGLAAVQAIDAKIVYIQSLPKYARPKRQYTTPAARALAIAERHANDDKLMADIAAQRDAAAARLKDSTTGE